MVRRAASPPPSRRRIEYNVGMAGSIDVYLEITAKRTFAGAIEWPGWARSGRDPESALANLDAYRERYGDALRTALIRPPAAEASLDVVARHEGGSGTEYGVASASPKQDDEPLAGTELDRQVRILEAAWAAFDRAAKAARGKELRTGPRGGGRDLAKIAMHVIEAEQAYIGQIGVKSPTLPADAFEALAPLHDVALDALRRRAAGELPDVGERGGTRWTPRYFVRRAAWHVLDHAWEIEDRAT
jgi:hypothetical protein